MAKTIVLCADGTWNGPEDERTAAAVDGNAPAAEACCSADLTNVCKLFAWLQGELQPSATTWGGVEMEKCLLDANGAPAQLAKYLHGVGNSADLADKVGGGAFGVGVTARIARGYTYVSRNYLAGDRIVIVGFSRGAYTARALAGLIAGQGLLRPELVSLDDDRRYDTAAAAWFRWRHGHSTTLQKIEDFAVELAELHGAFSRARTLDDDSFVQAPITAVAVWDTVGSLGIPTYHGDVGADLFRFIDTALSTKVQLGLHAVAVDEERRPFEPTLWDAAPNVEQALFPGGHCDIGGGYAEHGLSDLTLRWFVDRLAESDVALRFDAEPPVPVAGDPLAPRHRAWVGSALWLAAGIEPRSFPKGLAVDGSVRARGNGAAELLFGVSDNTAVYAPGNLPAA